MQATARSRVGGAAGSAKARDPEEGAVGRDSAGDDERDGKERRGAGIPWAIVAISVFATLSIIVGIVATREEDYSWEVPRIKRGDRGGGVQAVETAAAASQAAPSLSTSSAGTANDQGGQVLSTENSLAAKGKGAAVSAIAGADADELKYPYPFYKISLDEGGQKWKYPGAGWASSEKLTVEDKRFRSGFKFYMHEDGVFDNSETMNCFVANMKIEGWDKDKTRPHLLDHNLRLNQRQYLVEMHLFPSLRNHPQRTMNPEEAGAFFIEYSPYLNHQSYPCNTRTTKQWEQDLATELENNKWYQRNGGKDHFIFYMKYNIALPKPLTAVLEKGVNVITTDRNYWSISHNLKQTFQAGRVIVIPYVCSTFMDSPHIEYQSPHDLEKDESSHFMFFGNLRRRFGGRSFIMDLGEKLKGSNFRGTELHREPIPDVLNETALVMRKSSVCLAPSGDAPTSVRMFEAMASGCVPIVMGYRDKLYTDLPYPSLIDWDSVALFAQPLEYVTKRKDGLDTMAAAFEQVAGLNAQEDFKTRLEKMRKEGTRIFQEHLMFKKHPKAAADSLLFEMWMLLQHKGIIDGPFNSGSKH